MSICDQPTSSRSATEEKSGSKRDRSRPPSPEPLPAPVIDNHCHLDIADGPAHEWLNVPEALAAARGVNVTRIVQVGYDLQSSRWGVAAAQRFDDIVAAVALHPNEAPELAERGELDDALAEIEQLLGASDKVRAVGETGMDRFRTGADGQRAQEESFRAHIELAKRHDRTLVIHDRDTHEEILRIIDDAGAPERWVMHCFSGDADFARECVRRGAHLSFAGTVTFKNAPDLRAAAVIAPLDRILVETDAPFLTPMPYRGRPNASYLVPLTLRTIAETRGEDLTELCEAVWTNTEAAFGGPWGGD